MLDKFDILDVLQIPRQDADFWLLVEAISYWQRIQLGPRGLQPFTRFQDGSTKCVDMTVML